MSIPTDLMIFLPPMEVPTAITIEQSTIIQTERLSAINYKVVKDMVLTWVLTFPGCGLIGYAMAKLLLWIL